MTTDKPSAAESGRDDARRRSRNGKCRHIRLAVSLSALLISSTILSPVGVVAGMNPAIRASRLDPAQAMRSE